MGILRVLLALAVVLAHSNAVFGISLTGGIVAVQIFYIISGFYMALILSQKYVGLEHYGLFISVLVGMMIPGYIGFSPLN